MNHPEILPREFQILALVVLLAFLARLIRLVRTQKVTLRDSLLWVLSTVALIVITIFPTLLARLAHALQIQVPSNALFGASIFYLAVNLLSATIANSVNAANVRRLVQECALLRGELDSLRRELPNRAPASGQPGKAPSPS
jgi:hypothetical protein